MREVRLIQEWAIARGLHYADSAKQIIKLAEEFGELADGFNKMNREKVIDSIGDMFVVMTIFCLQQKIDIRECISIAYDEIKDRKGQMINGIFVKEEDLKEDEE